MFDINDFIKGGTVYQKSVKPLVINTVDFGIPEYNNHFAQIDSNTFNRLFGHNDIGRILINLKDEINERKKTNKHDSLDEFNKKMKEIHNE